MSFIVSAPLLKNPAVLNADNAVGKLGDLVVMGYHHQRLMEFAAGFFQQAQHITARPAVQIAGRFVSQDDGGLRNEGAGDGATLLLSPGQVVWHIVQL